MTDDNPIYAFDGPYKITGTVTRMPKGALTFPNLLITGDASMDTETILKFLMSKLSEADLAELDVMLVGPGSGEAEVAQDAAVVQRKNWIDMGAKARLVTRKARYDRVANDSASRKDFTERFPDAGRLK